MTRDERRQLSYELAEHSYEAMDLMDVHEYVVGHMVKAYDTLTDEELIEEAREYAPDLIDEEDDA